VLNLVSAVVAIAPPDSLNPSLIIAAVFLTLGLRPLRRTIAFTVSAFAVTLAGGLVVALGWGDLILSLLPKLSRPVKYKPLPPSLEHGLLKPFSRRRRARPQQPDRPPRPRSDPRRDPNRPARLRTRQPADHRRHALNRRSRQLRRQTAGVIPTTTNQPPQNTSSKEKRSSRR
jgi:hypothetical protein